MQNFILLSFILLNLIACQSNKVNNSVKGSSIFDDEYYITKASNNVERLKLLTSGCYVYYNKNTVDKTFTPWLVNDADSIILYTTPVGIPAKHGHWIYCHQFISSLPNKPLATYLIKYTQISRDSIQAVDYSCPPIPFNDLKDRKTPLFKDFDFDELDQEVKFVYVKTGKVEFQGYSEVFPNPKKNTKSFRKDNHTISPKYNIQISDYYKDSEGKNFIRRNHKFAYFVRIDPAKCALFND